MISRRSITALLASLTFAVACASAGSTTNTADKIIPPRMVTRATLPPIRFPSSGVGTRFEMEIEVLIDSTGIPVMSTFKIHGTAEAENRSAFYDWIANSVFDPARRDGQPVSAVFHTRIDFRREGR